MSFFDKVTDFLSDTATGIVGNYYGRKAASKANQYALYQSGTAHQREVQDLLAAGLNPVLSALGNGAATVAVPVNGGHQPQTAPMSSYRQANSAVSVAKAQKDLLSSQTRKTNAEADVARAEADYIKDRTASGSTAGKNIISPFDRAYYGDGPFGFGSMAREGTMRSVDGFRSIRNAVMDLFNPDAGSQGGRNSAKSIKEEKKESSRFLPPDKRKKYLHPDGSWRAYPYDKDRKNSEWLKRTIPSGAF